MISDVCNELMCQKLNHDVILASRLYTTLTLMIYLHLQSADTTATDECGERFLANIPAGIEELQPPQLCPGQLEVEERFACAARELDALFTKFEGQLNDLSVNIRRLTVCI